MATASEKGFVRIFFNDTNYDSPYRTKAQCMTILEKFKVAKEQMEVFDLSLVSGAHIFVEAEKIELAWYIPEISKKNDDS